MPSLTQLMNQEILRLARKEARQLLAGIKKDSVRLKKTVADLKRRVAQLERDNKRLVADQTSRKAKEMSEAPTSAPKARVSAKGIRSLRKKLGLSQGKFAMLIGTTGVTVYNWEKAEGALNLRERTRAAVVAIRGIGSKEAKAMLAKMDVPKKKAPKKKAAKKSAKRKTTKKK